MVSRRWTLGAHIGHDYFMHTNFAVMPCIPFYTFIAILIDAHRCDCQAIMSELIRDTIFGHLIRYLSGQKLLPYAEDRDPGLWKQYIHDEKTRRMAHHGHTGVEETGDGDTVNTSETPQSHGGTSRDSSTTRRESNMQTNVLGHPVDPEKGRDTNVVHWYGDSDPEVPSMVSHSTWLHADTRSRTL